MATTDLKNDSFPDNKKHDTPNEQTFKREGSDATSKDSFPDEKKYADTKDAKYDVGRDAAETKAAASTETRNGVKGDSFPDTDGKTKKTSYFVGTKKLKHVKLFEEFSDEEEEATDKKPEVVDVEVIAKKEEKPEEE